MGVYPGRENCPRNTCTKLNVVLPAMVAQCLQRFAAEPRGGRLDSRQHFNEGLNGKKKKGARVGYAMGCTLTNHKWSKLMRSPPLRGL